MDLLCCEAGLEVEPRAYADPVLLNDDRVLLNMLGQEEKYTPTTPFFPCVQKDITPHMRSIVSSWMMESWELLVLSKLKWDMSAVTPHDFFDHILRRLPVDTAVWDVGMIRRHTQTFIALCARDYQFSLHPPSMIASASLAAALDGLEWTKRSGCTLDQLLAELQNITSIEKDYLQTCLGQIEGMLKAMMRETSADCESSKLAELEQAGEGQAKAETPTDVQDIHF